MVEVPVYNLQGKEEERLALDPAIWDAGVAPGLLHLAVVRHLANVRMGTSDTKTRGEVRGGGRKPWRQKGTGRARQGSIRSPQWRKGGIVFGPHPRSHAKGMPRKMWRKSLFGVLSLKLKENNVCIVSDLIQQTKTKDVVKTLEMLNIRDTTVLVVLPAKSDNAVLLERSAGNLPYVCLISLHQLNPYDALRYKKILLDKNTILALEKMYSVKKREE